MFRGRFWRNFDWWLFGLAGLLIVTGILVLYSTTFKAATLANPVDTRNQIIFAIIGLAALLIMSYMDYRVWGKLINWLYTLNLGLLGFVMIAGKTALGATRWINLGFFQFQPSELMKLVLILMLAKFFARHYDEMNRPRWFLASAVYMAVPLVLVLAQPDLGTGIILVLIWLVMCLVARVRWSYLVGLGLLGVAALPLAIKYMRPYQRQRLATFFNPTADPLRTGYNVVQARIAVGSGQLFGRGLASGSQSQLNFLPSQHTDFIFAVLAEKMGFIGAGLLIILFGGLLLRGLVIAAKARDRFGMFVATGIVTMLLFHFFINVGMNMGIMPVTGIPLPFISYGGTSLLVAMIAIGLLESIAIRHKKIQFEN